MEKLDKLFEEAIFLTDKIAQTLDTQEDKHYGDYRDVLLSLRERYDKKQLNVLIAGEVGVGKSTFVNTLLKENVCETAEETCTNTASVIKYGETEKVTVYFNPTDNEPNPAPKPIHRSQIKEYTSEKWNSKNKKEARLIEIEIPNEVLKEGIVIIDTPGLGAIEPKHAVATYGIAPLADIIFFLGSTIRQLSSFEINHLKRLIECSKCDNIVHVLTKTDQGNPKVIMNENMGEISKVLPDKDISYFGVSSVLYNDYLNTSDEDDLKESGFTPLLAYIEQVGDKIQELLNVKYQKELFAQLMILYADVKTISDAANNPTIAEERLTKLQEIIARIDEIEFQNHAWRTSLNTGFAHMEVKLQSMIASGKVEMKHHIDSLLELDIYLKNPKDIEHALCTDMVCFVNQFQLAIRKGTTEIHTNLVRVSGLDEIRKDIYADKCFIPEEIEIEDFNTEWDFEKFATTIAGVVAGYFVAVALMKGGAVIGGIFGGPLGAFIGGILGGLAGLISTVITFLFRTKKQKQNKLRSLFYEATDKFFFKISSDIKSIIIEARSKMGTSFEDEILKEKKFCFAQKKRLEEIAGRDATYRSLLQKIVTAVETLIKKIESND